MIEAKSLTRYRSKREKRLLQDSIRLNIIPMQCYWKVKCTEFNSLSFTHFICVCTANNNETTQISWLGNHPLSFFLHFFFYLIITQLAVYETFNADFANINWKFQMNSINHFCISYIIDYFGLLYATTDNSK